VEINPFLLPYLGTMKLISSVRVVRCCVDVNVCKYEFNYHLVSKLMYLNLIQVISLQKTQRQFNINAIYILIQYITRETKSCVPFYHDRALIPSVTN